MPRATKDNELGALIGTRIKGLRTERGWTQRHLAALAGLAQGDISRYELGTAIPPLRLLARLARLLGATVDSLLREDSSRPTPGRSPLAARLQELRALPAPERRAALSMLDIFLAMNRFAHSRANRAHRGTTPGTTSPKAAELERQLQQEERRLAMAMMDVFLGFRRLFLSRVTGLDADPFSEGGSGPAEAFDRFAGGPDAAR